MGVNKAWNGAAADLAVGEPVRFATAGTAPGTGFHGLLTAATDRGTTPWHEQG